MIASELMEVLEIWKSWPVKASKTFKKEKYLRLRELGMSTMHSAQIAQISRASAVTYEGGKSLIAGGVRGWFDKLELRSLDAITLLAVCWEDDQTVSGKLVNQVIRWGTGLNTISYLTDIPIERLREEVGESLRNDSVHNPSVLGSGTDPKVS